jgi:hypothetical protein
MVLAVEEGPYLEALGFGHLLSPQVVGALGARNVHRPRKPTFRRDLLHTSARFSPSEPSINKKRALTHIGPVRSGARV